MTDKKSLIVITGPTAVGKTRVAIELARRFQTEIISADSRQFFQELSIGTAKPSPEELRSVPHHFINSHSIQEQYDAAQFAEDALETIGHLFTKVDFVVVCGGSGLYLRALTEGFDEIPEVDPQIRRDLINSYEKKGLSFLQSKMEELDPETLKTIDRHNPHRLMRALEVRIGTGKSITTFQNNKRRQHAFRIIKIGLDLPREELYERIDKRMDEMIQAGLFDEARAVVPFREHQALQTVGYQEIFAHFDGDYDRDDTIRLLKRNSRRYAKRQLTWFRRDPEMKWFSPNDIPGMIDEILSQSNS